MDFQDVNGRGSQTRNRNSAKYSLDSLVKRSYSALTLILIRGRVAEGKKLQRGLIRDIRRAIVVNRPDARLWCLLGDQYKSTAKQEQCFRQALRITPKDPEANAEMAYICACQGDRARFRRHYDRALASSRGFDIEDFVIYIAFDAAKEAADTRRAKRAMALGRRRFPKNTLFQP